eukprot:g6693.t1
MRRLSRDGKLCDGMENWNTWFDMNYPDCGADMTWAESNLKKDGVKVVKEESTTYNDNFIHGLNNLYETGQKVETKQNTKVTKTSGTINVGGTLDITGIVGDDGIRPAIDGGKTP